MEIKVRLFALLKEKTGCAEIQLHGFEGFRCLDVFSYFKDKYEELGPVLEQSLIAINGNYADKEAVLLPGDEVAILPPISGG